MENVYLHKNCVHKYSEELDSPWSKRGNNPSVRHLMNGSPDERNACMLSPQSCLTLCNPMNCSPPGSLSMGFSRQEHWSGSPYSPSGHLPDAGMEPESLMSPALAGRFLTTSATWEALASIFFTETTCPSPSPCDFPSSLVLWGWAPVSPSTTARRGRETTFRSMCESCHSLCACHLHGTQAGGQSN